MRPATSHIILIGFKHVGKSRLGRVLATKIAKPFLDLDGQIEINYAAGYQKIRTCREIMQQHGEPFFRELEASVLQNIIHTQPAVIALGGGAPLNPLTQKLLKTQTVVYVTAQPEIVFQRIMAKGLPTFFAKGDDPWLEFNRLWQEREPVYQCLADITVDNSGDFTHTIKQLVNIFHR